MRRILAALLLATHAAHAEAPSLTLPIPPGPPPATCTPIASPATATIALRETFRDDFDAFDPYAGPWTPHFDHNTYDDWRARTLTGNGEIQLYVDPRYRGAAGRPLGLDPFRAAGGTLTITAKQTPSALRRDLHDFPYVSGMISSRRSFLQRYGYFEIGARLPFVAGAWPAFWLLSPGAWPPEIDVIEMRGDEPAMHVHLHWSEDGAHRASGCRLPLADPGGVHSYGLLWQPDSLVYYLDREPVAWLRSRPGFDRPMYLLANLAVGGAWAGTPEPGGFPASYGIDWIAAYRIDRAGVR
jgi:beta-glucanase (GH16 family)